MKGDLLMLFFRQCTIHTIHNNCNFKAYIYMSASQKVALLFLFVFLQARVSLHQNPSLPGANSSLVCWFCLVLFQCFFLSGRMSALCARPSPRTLDVISSTWSLHYLLSSTMLPSRCSATWNAWLASSLKPSWNCALKRCRLFLLSSPSSHVCRSQKKIPPLLLSQRENKQGKPFSRLPPLPPTDFIKCMAVVE